MQDVVDALDGLFVKLHVALLPLVCLAAGTSGRSWSVEVVHQVGGALDTGVGQLAYLLGVVSVPSPTVEIAVKVKDELGVDEVCECIAHVAAVVVVDRQVEKVYPHSMDLPNLLQQHLFRVLVWDMPYHHRCPSVCLNLLQGIRTCSGIILNSLASSPDTVRRLRWQFWRW
jgi:hypothetical protein